MNIRVFHGPPHESLGAALEVFEAQFRYPLGTEATFSISHGRRYTTFFEAIGEPTLVVAERDGVVLGTIAAALRPLRFPDGGVHRVAYIGDLKVTPSARGGVLLARMFQELYGRLGAATMGRGYAIVMDGTGRTPPAYTGRVAIPRFLPAGGISVLKIAAESSIDTLRNVGLERFDAVDGCLLRSGFRPIGGRAESRSSVTPICLANEDDSACGRLEDTRKAKRLVLPNGGELIAAHLSGFAWRSPRDGARFLRGVSARCAVMGIPAFFTAVPSEAKNALLSEMPGVPVTVAPATVYSCGFRNETLSEWFVDSSEI